MGDTDRPRYVVCDAWKEIVLEPGLEMSYDVGSDHSKKADMSLSRKTERGRERKLNAPSGVTYFTLRFSKSSTIIVPIWTKNVENL